MKVLDAIYNVIDGSSVNEALDLLIEGKYDALVTSISRHLINKIKDQLRKYENHEIPRLLFMWDLV